MGSWSVGHWSRSRAEARRKSSRAQGFLKGKNWIKGISNQSQHYRRGDETRIREIDTVWK